jgi:hypothetical protein
VGGRCPGTLEAAQLISLCHARLGASSWKMVTQQTRPPQPHVGCLISRSVCVSSSDVPQIRKEEQKSNRKMARELTDGTKFGI